MSKKVLITTPIYYPNDKLHIGHAYTTTIADFLSRFNKMLGNEVFFITGSDEHGQKIQDKAEELGRDTLEYVTEIVETFKDLWNKLDVEYDQFIRTTDKIHEDFVSGKFNELKEKGFIYKGEYSGNYCKSCEEFFTDSQLNEGKCPSCGKETKVLSEPSYFLELSKYQDWIKDKLENENILVPAHKAKELVNNFIDSEEGLGDLSITRTSFDWGIKIEGDEEHVIYVWLDALLNYISAFKYGTEPFSLEETWKTDDVELIQLVGKEITRFHSIYWPIMLDMLGYRLPKVYAHGWLLSDDGGKMSKSKGNVIDPINVIEEYGSDALRWYLLNGVSFGEDGRISNDLLKENINGILVNKYSNLISRTQKMLFNTGTKIIPEYKHQLDSTENFNIKINDLKESYIEKVKAMDLTNSTKEIIKILDIVNGFIDETEPWKKEGEELNSILNVLYNGILKTTTLISSIMPNSSSKVFEALGVNEINISLWDKDLAGTEVAEIDNLFMRLK